MLNPQDKLAIGFYFPSSGTELQKEDLFLKSIKIFDRASSVNSDLSEALLFSEAKAMIKKILLDFFAQHPDAAVCAVPFHNPQSTTPNFYGFINDIMRLPFLAARDARLCLTRTRAVDFGDVEGSANTLQAHKLSLNINNSDSLVRGKTIILLDNVLTSGVRFESCKEKLMGAGAKEVICLAFARTVHDGETVSISEAQKELNTKIQETSEEQTSDLIINNHTLVKKKPDAQATVVEFFKPAPKAQPSKEAAPSSEEEIKKQALKHLESRILMLQNTVKKAQENYNNKKTTKNANILRDVKNQLKQAEDRRATLIDEEQHQDIGTSASQPTEQALVSVETTNILSRSTDSFFAPRTPRKRPRETDFSGHNSSSSSSSEGEESGSTNSSQEPPCKKSFGLFLEQFRYVQKVPVENTQEITSIKAP